MNPCRNARAVRGGFTLTELLVAIAIIVVLAALSFVVVRKGLGMARSAQCTNNIRSIVQAHVILSQDNNGVIVHAWKSNAFGSWNRNWSEFHAIAASDDLGWRASRADVMTQMRTMDHLQCPVAAREQRKEMRDDVTHSGWRTYAMNQWVGAVSDPGNSQYGWVDGAVTISQVESPAKLIFIAEKSWSGANYTGAFGPVAGPDTYADFHGGYCHVGYFDGHVDRMRPEELPLKGTQLPNGETVDINNPSNVESSLIWRGRSVKRP